MDTFASDWLIGVSGRIRFIFSFGQIGKLLVHPAQGLGILTELEPRLERATKLNHPLQSGVKLARKSIARLEKVPG